MGEDVVQAEPTRKEDEPVTDSTAIDAEHPTNSSTPSVGQTTTVSNDVNVSQFYCSQLMQDIAQSLHADPDSEYAAHARNLNGFFTVLALCHTVLTSVDPATGKILYKAQSPDEAALVKAAADCGYVFKGRDREILSLQKPSAAGEETLPVEKYELLNILEFTSSRKRMSVVVRRLDSQDSRVFLLTKGADSVIFERLRPGIDDTLREMTEMHLSEFANGGLRTLTLGYKIVPGQCILCLRR